MLHLFLLIYQLIYFLVNLLLLCMPEGENLGIRTFLLNCVFETAFMVKQIRHKVKNNILN